VSCQMTSSWHVPGTGGLAALHLSVLLPEHTSATDASASDQVWTETDTVQLTSDTLVGQRCKLFVGNYVIQLLPVKINWTKTTIFKSAV